jgi:hypothetical protein
MSASIPIEWTREGWIVFERDVYPDREWVSYADDLHEHVFAVRPNGAGLHMVGHRPGRRETLVLTRP